MIFSSFLRRSTMIRRVLISVSIGLAMIASGLASASYSNEGGTVNALSAVGAKLGWSFHLTPPDPCAPGELCKSRLAVAVDTDVRGDLDQEITFLRHDTGEQINPCI